MDPYVFYPPRDFGPLMKGLVIGGMGIFHVFLAQFAIGGGMLMSYLEWLHGKGRSAEARTFLDGFFRALVLISFVLGAVTGVGMWLTSIQIGPRTIGRMVEHFHWVWAIEWTFFSLEVAAGYTYYRYASRMTHRERLTLLGLYSVASWASLFWINGILAWQLTPGAWIESREIWSGFFNPGFWPSLLFRTVASMAIASLVAMVVINAMADFDREQKQRLLRVVSRFLLPMLSMPLLAGWYLATMPEDSRGWVMGGSVAMSLFFGAAVGASVLIAAYAVFALAWRKLYINGATALLLTALAFAATAGGEFVREGARKPFTIRKVLYSNSITPAEVVTMREQGAVVDDPYPLERSYPTPQLELGARVFRHQCEVCHTMAGVNGVVHLAGTWTADQKRMNIAKLQHTKAFMPPFAGTAEELEALVQLLTWEHADGPSTWPVSDDPATLKAIREYLEEAGPWPTSASQRTARVEGGS